MAPSRSDPSPLGSEHEASALDEDSSASSVASSDDEQGKNDDDVEFGSDSDSLDSASPRKRRRTSPDGNEEAVPQPTALFNAPSRIRRRPPLTQQQQQPPSQQGESDDAAVEEALRSLKPLRKITAPTDPNASFESMGLQPWLVQSLSNMAIKRPTGIQKNCIPEILKGRDCIGGSRTGSGKTVAFAAPILDRWSADPCAIYAVVLTPTR